MAIQGIRNIVPARNPLMGTKRGHRAVVESGIDRNNPTPETEAALKTILKIEGDAVGTLNEQDIENKGLDSGTFI